jgi:hypothetical protein
LKKRHKEKPLSPYRNRKACALPSELSSTVLGKRFPVEKRENLLPCFQPTPFFLKEAKKPRGLYITLSTHKCKEKSIKTKDEIAD